MLPPGGGSILLSGALKTACSMLLLDNNGSMDHYSQIPIESRRHMAAMDQGRQQLNSLEAMKDLWDAQAAEMAANAERERHQQAFNRRMSWTAAVLAGAAVVVPFAILWIEQTIQ